MEQAIIWLWFAGLFGRGTRLSHEVLEFFHSAPAVFAASETELRQSALLTRDQVEQVLRHDTSLAERQYADALREGCRVLTPGDGEYPVCLEHIYAPPAALLIRGSLAGLEQCPAIAVVGSRRSDEYGLTAAAHLAGELAAAGAAVISGLAMGIDQAAHRAAIKAEGVTIGVLGCGIDLDYPKGSRPLRELMAETGAVVTEYPVGEPARPGNFPMRNRIISGLARGVLVVRADEYSGSLITAGHALSQGRDVFAVPGRIDEPLSRGTNKLLLQGAKPVTCAADILDEYAGVPDWSGTVYSQLTPDPVRLRAAGRRPRQKRAEGRPVPEGKTAPVGSVPERKAPDKAVPRRKAVPDYLSRSQAQLLERIGSTPVTADRLAVQSGRPVGEILSALSELEIYGLIESHGPAGYTAL